MSGEATAPRGARPCAATASYTVQFRKRPRRHTQRQQESPPGRVPRVARLLALAHKIDGMIRSGEIKDWAEAARLVGVTRARMTQIANLLLLAPEIQKAILALPEVFMGRDPIKERGLRHILTFSDWRRQLRAWSDLELSVGPPYASCRG